MAYLRDLELEVDDKVRFCNGSAWTVTKMPHPLDYIQYVELECDGSGDGWYVGIHASDATDAWEKIHMMPVIEDVPTPPEVVPCDKTRVWFWAPTNKLGHLGDNVSVDYLRDEAPVIPNVDDIVDIDGIWGFVSEIQYNFRTGDVGSEFKLVVNVFLRDKK